MCRLFALNAGWHHAAFTLTVFTLSCSLLIAERLLENSSSSLDCCNIVLPLKHCDFRFDNSWLIACLAHHLWCVPVNHLPHMSAMMLDCLCALHLWCYWRFRSLITAMHRNNWLSACPAHMLWSITRTVASASIAHFYVAALWSHTVHIWPSGLGAGWSTTVA